MDSDLITQATEVVKNGGIIIYPTDTAYGIGCRIDDHTAVDRLFTIRKRDRTKAVPILVSSKDMAGKYFRDMPSHVSKLADTYWPGALTVVYFADTSRIYEPLRGGGRTVGIRMPDHPVPLSIISALGVPIVGTSANYPGEKTPFSLEEVDSMLKVEVDMTLTGGTKQKSVSTVIDCTYNPPQVIRPGKVRI